MPPITFTYGCSTTRNTITGNNQNKKVYINLNKSQHKMIPAVKLLKHKTSKYGGNCWVLLPKSLRGQRKVMYSSQLSPFIYSESGHCPADPNAECPNAERTHRYKLKHTQSDNTPAMASQCSTDKPAAWNEQRQIMQAVYTTLLHSRWKSNVNM